jgi:ribosomal protein S18 acetylase RimI-like enzyme
VAELEIRRFEANDLSACAQIAIRAWEVKEVERADVRAWEIYLRHFLSKSNYAEVVCDSEAVVGTIFGRIGIGARGASFKGEGITTPRLIAGILLGNFDKSHGILRVLWTFLMTEFKLALNMPHSDSEITFLILDEKHRGKGIGRMMVERFVNAARGSGARSMTVYTENQTSNWQFYERFGFHRVGSFYDDLNSYFVGKKSTAYMYYLDLVGSGSGPTI